MTKTLALALLVASLLPLPPGIQFAATLPIGTPRLEGWERITGEIELASPRARVQYEFYVNPERPGLYELIRYRVTLPPGDQATEYPAVEKVQWQASQSDMRRYECGAGEGPGAPCRWRQLKTGSPEYHREMPVILWLYGLHRRALQEREEAGSK